MALKRAADLSPADGTRWYVYRWMDETRALAGAPGAGSTPTHPVTWGAIKAAFR